MKSRKTLLLVAAAALLLGSNAVAGPVDKLRMHMHANGSSFNDPGGVVRLDHTVFQWAALGTALTGFNTIQVGRNVFLNCRQANGCIIAARITAELQPVGNSTLIGIWAEVDGNNANPTVQFANTGQAGVITEAVFDGSLMVSEGHHKIQYFIEPSAAASLLVWHERTDDVFQ